MVPVSTSSVRQQQIASIYASSATGAGGEIDRATLTNMFACLKILGFNKVKFICQTALSENVTPADIANTISRLGLNPDQMKNNGATIEKFSRRG